ncbi:MAG: hypothetical protein ABJK11_09335 [Balneola sp.]
MKTLAFLLLLLFTNCSWVINEEEPPIEFVTEILEVKVSPNPVKLGDMVTFTCLIKDSTDPNLEFAWAISGYQGVTRTVENTITVKAITLGKNSNIVRVVDTTGVKTSVSFDFEYSVIE